MATIIIGRILANAKTNAKNMANPGYSFCSVLAWNTRYDIVKIDPNYKK